MSSPLIVDIHSHVISRDTERYPLQPIGGKQSSWSQARSLAPDELLSAMEAAGVARTAVVHASTAYGFDNSYVADSVQGRGDRMLGVGSVDLLAADAVPKLEYWIEQRGLAGLRVFTTGSTMPDQAAWFIQPETFPAWEWVSSHQISVCLQMTPAGLPMLKQLLDRFPDLIIILDHFARVSEPKFEADQGAVDALMALADCPGIYLKLTTKNLSQFAANHRLKQRVLGAALDRYGSGRIAWGSNFPREEGTLTELVELAKAELSEYPDADVANVLGKTALRIYPALNGSK